MTLHILPQPEWITWLSSEIQSRGDTALLVYRAEQMLVDRYRGGKDPGDIEGNVLVDNTTGMVLEDWAEDEDGNPDVAQMPDGLANRLRDSVSRIVTHWHESPDGTIKRKLVGSRSVTYKGKADKLPRSVFRPLRPYDDRTPAMM